MSGNDYRKGFFNDAENHGTQVYNEGPRQRTAPNDLSLLGPSKNLMVQVRVYGMSPEQRKFGRDIIEKLAASGVQVNSFGDDHGTDEFEGITIACGNDASTAATADQMVRSFGAIGLTVRTELVPSWPADFIRIGVGS